MTVGIEVGGVGDRDVVIIGRTIRVIVWGTRTLAETPIFRSAMGPPSPGSRDQGLLRLPEGGARPE